MEFGNCQIVRNCQEFVRLLDLLGIVREFVRFARLNMLDLLDC